MPLYEYLCDKCGHRFEVIQKFSDPPLDVCPNCHGAVRKQISSPAFQFKGSGWYITDYARKDGSNGAKPPAESAPKGDNESAPKGDKPSAGGEATGSSGSPESSSSGSSGSGKS